MKTALNVLLLLLLLTATGTATAAEHTKDSLDTVKGRLAAKKAVLVDVREQSEWNAGHLAVAQNVPLSWITKQKRSVDVAKKLDKSKILYLHCRSGRRVLVAAASLAEFGYDVRPLKQGFAQLAEEGFTRAK